MEKRNWGDLTPDERLLEEQVWTSVSRKNGVPEFSSNERRIRCISCYVKVDRDTVWKLLCGECQQAGVKTILERCERCRRLIPVQAFFGDLDNCAYCFIHYNDQPQRNLDTIQRIYGGGDKRSSTEVVPVPGVELTESDGTEKTMVLDTEDDSVVEVVRELSSAHRVSQGTGAGNGKGTESTKAGSPRERRSADGVSHGRGAGNVREREPMNWYNVADESIEIGGSIPMREVHPTSSKKITKKEIRTSEKGTTGAMVENWERAGERDEESDGDGVGQGVSQNPADVNYVSPADNEDFGSRRERFELANPDEYEKMSVFLLGYQNQVIIFRNKIRRAPGTQATKFWNFQNGTSKNQWTSRQLSMVFLYPEVIEGAMRMSRLTPDMEKLLRLARPRLDLHPIRKSFGGSAKRPRKSVTKRPSLADNKKKRTTMDHQVDRPKFIGTKGDFGPSDSE